MSQIDSFVTTFFVEGCMEHVWGEERGVEHSMIHCDWWSYCSLRPIIQSSQCLHLRLSSIRRVGLCHFATTPPGYQSFLIRLQVKMNSLNINSAEQEENKNPGMLLILPPFSFHSVLSHFPFVVFLLKFILKYQYKMDSHFYHQL